MEQIRKRLTMNHTTDQLLNCLVVGTPGAGKTYNYVIPNIKTGYASYVVYDVDGMIHRQTHSVLTSKGYDVLSFDFSKDDPYAIDMTDLCSRLGRKKTAVFVIHSCLSFNDTSCSSKEAQFLEKLITILTLNCMASNSKRLEVPVEFYFDDFCNMPPLKDLDKVLVECRDYNINFNIISMGLPQLEEYCEKCCDFSAVDLNCGCDMFVQIGHRLPKDIIDILFRDPTDVKDGQVLVAYKDGTHFVDDIYKV